MAIWTVGHQAPLSMGFSREEYLSGLLCFPPGDIPDPGIGPKSPALRQILNLLSHQGSPQNCQPYLNCWPRFRMISSVTTWLIECPLPASFWNNFRLQNGIKSAQRVHTPFIQIPQLTKPLYSYIRHEINIETMLQLYLKTIFKFYL